MRATSGIIMMMVIFTDDWKMGHAPDRQAQRAKRETIPVLIGNSASAWMTIGVAMSHITLQARPIPATQ
jgi:hypothetical protein